MRYEMYVLEKRFFECLKAEEMKNKIINLIDNDIFFMQDLKDLNNPDPSKSVTAKLSINDDLDVWTQSLIDANDEAEKCGIGRFLDYVENFKIRKTRINLFWVIHNLFLTTDVYHAEKKHIG